MCSMTKKVTLGARLARWLLFLCCFWFPSKSLTVFIITLARNLGHKKLSVVSKFQTTPNRFISGLSLCQTCLFVIDSFPNLGDSSRRCRQYNMALIMLFFSSKLLSPPPPLSHTIEHYIYKFPILPCLLLNFTVSKTRPPLRNPNKWLALVSRADWWQL